MSNTSKQSKPDWECPQCKHKPLKTIMVLYSCPLIYKMECPKCLHKFEKEFGEYLKVLSGEDAVRARPYLYIDDERFPEWQKIAREEIKKSKKNET